MKKDFNLAYIFFFFSSSYIGCVDIGSDTSPARFEYQVSVNDGDRIAGFAALEAGFRFAGAVVTATFDSFFPVSGSIELNCGTLVLERDLIFSDTTQIIRLGHIEGQDHTLEFSSNITAIPFDPNFYCCEFGCITDNLVDYAGESQDVKSVDWTYDDEYIISGLGNASPSYVKIFSFSNDELGATPASYSLTTRNVFVVRAHPSDYFIAVGCQKSNGEDELHILKFNPGTNTITSQSSINFGDSVFAVAWHPSGDYLAVGREQNNQEIEVFSVDSNGNINATPVETIALNRRYVGEEGLDWNENEYLAAAVALRAGNPTCLIYEWDGGTTTLTANGSYSFGGTANTVDWNPTHTGFLAVGLNGGANRLAVVEHDSSGGGSVQLRTSFGSNTLVYAVDWSPNGNCLSVGSRFSAGIGDLEEFETFRYDFENYTLTSGSKVAYSKSTESLRWRSDGAYIALGSQINQLDVYATGCACGSLDCVTFSDLNIFLNNDLMLRDCCIIFDGESTICGRGNCLSLEETCTIIVDTESSLELKDLTLKGIHDERFYCTDTLSTLTFSDVDIILDNNYSFSLGKFDVINDVHIFGEGNIFAYQSSTTSIIKENSALILENNVTFSYDASIDSSHLFAFEDNTSELRLNGATLHSTVTGLQLTKGVFTVDRNSSLSSEATVEAEAIVFGDGASAANNVCIDGLPEENLNVTQGIVKVDNVG